MLERSPSQPPGVRVRFGQHTRDWDGTADRVWLDRYGGLLADLRASLRWSLGPGGDPASGGPLAHRSGIHRTYLSDLERGLLSIPMSKNGSKMWLHYASLSKFFGATVPRTSVND